MRSLFSSLVLALAARLASSSPCRPRDVPQACEGNTPDTRTQWCEYDINTDFDKVHVDTGNIKEYWLDVTDVTVAPDGIPRTAMAVNGSIPGPTLFADWGDTVVIHLTNSLTESLNGSSIHWHGIRQNHTNQHDGVVSITQCPLAPGQSMTYTWKAAQYGTAWYHSHFGIQAWQGVLGGLIINGPASANYDEDLGVVFLNDWDHQTVDELHMVAQTRGPPTLDNGLINGTNVWTDEEGTTTGDRFNVKFAAGTSYRMRLVGGAIDTHWKFSIDNHKMTVIANDLVPVEPWETTILDISMGQRYDVIVTANQADVADTFWMRAIPQIRCSDNESINNIKGIVYYGDSPSEPETTAYEYVDGCDDQTTSLVPVVPHDVSAADWVSLSTASVSPNSAGLFKWYLNSTSMLVDWGTPSLQSIVNGVTAFEDNDAVIELNVADQWVYFVIETNMPIPHPIHLHGHDYYVLAQGTGSYSSDVVLNTSNPPRRDTAMLPASGYLVMAWQANNPGVWLMHCHIGWHASEGFAVQFVERQSEIPDITDVSLVDEVCEHWNLFQETHEIEQHDSGV
ncbi:multicopper oxidase-domain-containing protein [Dactylonectria estremocensis]|uniref:laccase n=1 Tax=Dactylonectria estremocensis TaxID=1079267 RepID=A0A9P9JBF0_9HYPO|nr:multicopper oxidase-domain-containing protein [Dactylonectria estremocensis]